MNETIHAVYDEWRKALNRAVHSFASAAANADEPAIQVLATAMLREIGEALGVEAAALLALPETDHAGAHYQWSRVVVPSTGRPFEGTAFQALIAQLDLSRLPVVVTTEMDPDADAVTDEIKAYLRRTMVRMAVVIPIGVGLPMKWAWVFGPLRDDPVWPESVIEHLQVLGDQVSGVLQRRLVERGAEADEAGVVRAGARSRLSPSPRPAYASSRFEEIIGQSRVLQAALARLEEVVDTDSSVLLLGETGTGKELFARTLHARGPRRTFPLVSVNCAALPPTLIESELFGHQRGAFTGAVTLRQGRFELAHRGTLFLDEIGDLPMDLQPKLLRVLQEGAFERVGSSQSHTVDVRIVAATHRDLARAVAEAEFRADLFYRLNVFPIRVPPLRERAEDIPALVWTIIRKRQAALQRHITTVSPEVIAALQEYPWPGNIRELENVIERALIHTTGSTLTLLEGSLDAPAETPVGTTLMSVERAHIEDVLRDCGWRINGNGNAAERLGLHPNTLRFRMKKLGIVRHDANRDARRLRPESDSHVRNRAS